MRGLQALQSGGQWRRLSAAGALGRKQASSRSLFVKASSSQEFAAAEERAAGQGGVEGLGLGEEKEEMVSVQFRGNDILVPKGAILRTALLKNGLTPHSSKAVFVNCRGAATCGTCAVHIEGNVMPVTWGAREAIRMKLPPYVSPRSADLRLACQVRLDGDVKVTKYDKFWGQGTVPLEPTSASSSVTPLGNLEFVLDSKLLG